MSHILTLLSIPTHRMSDIRIFDPKISDLDKPPNTIFIKFAIAIKPIPNRYNLCGDVG